jgi:hypothetical protein
MEQIKNVVGQVSDQTLVKVVIPSSPFLGQEAMVPVSSLRESMGIKEFRITIPGKDAAELFDTPFLIGGLTGTIIILGGFVYLSPEATFPIDSIGSFSIIGSSGGEVYFKSAAISQLDPGRIAYVSSALAETNIPVTNGKYSLVTTGNSTEDPGANLYLILYVMQVNNLP